MTKSFKFTPILLAMIFLLVSCSGGGEQSEQVQDSATPAVEEPTEKTLSPEELGNKIGELYTKALKEVTDILMEKPEVSTVRTQVEELKESFVQELVLLGELREKLDDPARAVVDSRISSHLYSTNKEPWYESYNDIQMHYFQDREFHKIVISFNIIGQYANFDLLKKQSPEEAKRLGIGDIQ